MKEKVEKPSRAIKAAWVAMLVVALLAPAGISSSLGGRASAQGAHKAIVVIDFGGGRVEQRCVYFDGEYITGDQALAQAVGGQVVYQYSTLGVAVCKIRDVGCDDPSNCFCKSYAPPYSYWSYWIWSGGGWQYSQVGCSGRKLYDGDADGWGWVGKPSQSPNFGECAPAEPTLTPSPTPTWTITPAPSPTSTSTPTDAPTMTATPTKPPTVTPTASLPSAPTNTPTGTPTVIMLASASSTPTPLPATAASMGAEEQKPAGETTDEPTPAWEEMQATAAEEKQPGATLTPELILTSTPQPAALTVTPWATEPRSVADAPDAGSRPTHRDRPTPMAEAPTELSPQLVRLGLLGISVLALGGAIVLGLALAILWRRWSP